MPDWFIPLILCLLGALAIIDLFVGVSNDAVNFLNAAVGSRTAPFYVIMTVASLGVLLGATFSSGLMDVAKTGVLVPEQFTFAEVIVVFTAVMVTDVLLLNTFNSLGLPTSTTVSIVFELLGGATAMAFYKVWTSGAPVTDIGLFVNSGKALAMIMAILVSVIIAFVFGTTLQYLFRVVFSFNMTRTYRWFGGLFAGASLTSIFYFLVIKGAKGASFMQPAWIDYLEANTATILWTMFAVLTVFFQLLVWARINVFRVVILSGTFALAFAFAGNDLVNFVGVPLAALESAHIFEAVPGADPETFMMGGLRSSTTTPTFYLLGAGMVMALTLWFSKKAHRVIRTSVNLASSSRGGKEQFGSSLPARVAVRSALHLNSLVHQLIPKSVMQTLALRFKPYNPNKGEPPLPFDELRASLNLVIAATLIATATSYKLPLSTTYVTFMVAMGSSLADGAWDRESAVYRVSGVLTVISGWFVTAFTAFLAAATLCVLFIKLGNLFIVAMMFVAMGVVIKSNFFHKAETTTSEALPRITAGDAAQLRDYLGRVIDRNLKETLSIFARSLRAFTSEDQSQLRSLKDQAVQLYDDTAQGRSRYYELETEDGSTKQDRDARSFYYRAFTCMKELSHALRDVIGVSENYVANSHSPFEDEMLVTTQELANELERLEANFTPGNCRRVVAFIESAQNQFIAHGLGQKISLRKSELYLGYLLFAREVVDRYSMIARLQDNLMTRLQAKDAVAVTKEVLDPKYEPLEVSER